MPGLAGGRAVGLSDEAPRILLGLWAPTVGPRPGRHPGRPAGPPRAGRRVPQRPAARGARARARRADGRRRRRDRPDHPGRRRAPGRPPQSGRRAAARASLRRRARADVRRRARLRASRAATPIDACPLRGGHGDRPARSPYRETAIRGRGRQLDPGGRRLLPRSRGRSDDGAGGRARATAILRDISAHPRPRGAARGLRRDRQPRAAHAARADPRLRRDAAPPRARPGRAARTISSGSTR